MSITAALQALYGERDRLAEEQARVDQAIAALEGLDTSSKPAARPTKRDGRSAPKPAIRCPFCEETAKGMAGVAAHIRAAHPDRYPADYEEWKRKRT